MLNLIQHLNLKTDPDFRQDCAVVAKFENIM